jgi:hypothetical protein
MIKRIEIIGFGEFDVSHDLLHRPKSYLKLNTKNTRFKEVQFDSFNDDARCLNGEWSQLGYDYEGNEIQIKIKKIT